MADQSYYGHAPTAQVPTEASPSPAAATANSSIDADKIFVGGLSWQTTEESLKYHFEQFGPVVSAEVMRDRNTGDPRGFAFVVFASPSTVDVVMEAGRHEINHKIVDVKRAQKRGMAPPSIHPDRRPAAEGGGASLGARKHQQGLSPEHLQNKVFIGGLPPSVDNNELKSFFEQFGTVVDAIVMMDPVQQRSRGFGFVTFENGTEGAQKAVANQPVLIHGRHAEVKLATPKGEQTPRQPANLGLRAGVSSGTGEFAGLAAAFGRSGWKAGYGTLAFGKGGWRVKDWETFLESADVSGFSFDMLKNPDGNDEPSRKRPKRS